MERIDKSVGLGARPHTLRRVLSLAMALPTIAATLLSAAPALAAAPEAPELTVAQPIQTTEATFLGTLSPNASEPNKGGIYRFLYNTGAKCEGGKTTEPGLSLGAAHEELPAEPVTGLTPGTKYTVCLSITNLHGEATLSAPVPFTTPTVPQVPTTSSPAKTITARTAVLEGTLNPTAAAEVGWHFLYSIEPACSASGLETTPVQGAPVPAKTKVHIEVTELQPHHKYQFCLVARNEAGETAQSANEVSFETKAATPSADAESTSAVNSTSATLEAQVNPNNESTSAYLLYSTSPAVEPSGALKTPTELLPAATELGEGFGAQAVSQSLSGLPAASTFYYQAVAMNATGTTYGAVQSFTTVPVPATAQTTAITATTAAFNGTLTPLNATVPTSYSFEYRAGTECTGENATSTESAGTGSGAKSVLGEVAGLSPNTTYTVCLLASNASGSEQAAPVTFTTPVAAPKIESESSANTDATEARLRATINPGNSPTSYHFEYGPAAGSYVHSVPVPDGQIPARLTAVSVNNVLTGLTPATTYHYRVVASNTLPSSTQYGEDETFTTTATATGPGTPGGCTNEHLREEQPYGLLLPDCRAYEMVSPADTDGQDATSTYSESSARASEAPEGTEPAITYSAKGSFGDPRGALVENQYLSRRTPSGWATRAITPLSSTGAKGGTEPNEDSYPASYFTPELTAGLAVTSASLGEAPPLGEDTPIKLYVAQLADGSYGYVGQGELPGGASSNLERVLLTNAANGSLLEWMGGTDVPVSVANTSVEELPASAGSGEYFEKQKDAWHATSSDGTRVYFTTPPNVEDANEQLFERVNIGQPQSELGAKGECLEPTLACTVAVSASQRRPEDVRGPQPARYWGASADGTRVFFTSSAELTEDAYTGTTDNAPNLYEYDLETGSLTDLTVDSEDAAEGAAVQGVVQISDDGSYVYFVADGVLKGVHEEPLQNASGVEPLTGQDNLYVSHDGATAFIAALGAKDETDWLNGGNASEAGPEINTAVLTPGGSQLAFISERALTSYDNEQAEPGDCEAKVENHGSESGMCREVYVYDAETHALACASCNPTGARPAGPSILPGVVPAGQAYADYRPRDFLADGSLFFDSSDALAPGSSGSQEDVYEYESGNVHAISDPASGHESFFLDASPNGHNVFFASAAKLLPEDPGGNTVVWDARVDGGLPLASTPVPCATAETCQTPAAPGPAPGAPASATFKGPGNPTPAPPPATKPKTAEQLRLQRLARALKSCRKKKPGHKRALCEKQARKTYAKRASAKKAAKRPGSDRGAKR